MFESSLTQALSYYGTKTRVKLLESVLNNEIFHAIIKR